MHQEIAVLIPIVAILSGAWITVTLIRFKQAARGNDGLLERQNDELRATVARLEARMAVLEQIATDPAQRTAREIEELRYLQGR